MARLGNPRVKVLLWHAYFSNELKKAHYPKGQISNRATYSCNDVIRAEFQGERIVSYESQCRINKIANCQMRGIHLQPAKTNEIENCHNLLLVWLNSKMVPSSMLVCFKTSLSRLKTRIFIRVKGHGGGITS